jgi:hypothetical protein
VPLFEKAVNLAGSSYVYWGNLGDAYRWAPGDSAKAGPAYANAIRLAKEEIARNPQDLDLQSMLALYLAKSGDKQAALQQIEIVDRAPKKSGEVWFDSAVVHELCGERNQALADIAGALKTGYGLKQIQNERNSSLCVPTRATKVSSRANPQNSLSTRAELTNGVGLASAESATLKEWINAMRDYQPTWLIRSRMSAL